MDQINICLVGCIFMQIMIHQCMYCQDGLDDTEFPENIEDFVTLDELDSTAGETALGTSNCAKYPVHRIFM